MNTSKIIFRVLTLFVAVVAFNSTLTGTADAQSTRKQSRSTVQQSRNTVQQSPLQQLQTIAQTNNTQLGLEGYCPVCVVKGAGWVRGDANLQVAYDGKTYFFPGKGPMQEFQRSPEKYVPALGGDCTVCYAKAHKRMPGNIRFASLHKNRLYLFPGDKERNVFNASPGTYENTDLGIDGNCIVCQAKASKVVPGDAQFTAIHNGIRYQFPSDKERQVFGSSPEKFIMAVSANKTMMKDPGTMKDKPMMKETMMKDHGMTKDHDMMKDHEMTKMHPTQFRGMTACARCEFGVKPLGSPDELGLAVKAGDGKIYVIEEGHQRWPRVYSNRFDGQQVAISGKIIKTKGNVSWVQAEQLTVL